MAQTKITIVGKLRFSEGEGLAYSIAVAVGEPPDQKTLWLAAGPENAHDWPGLGKYPEPPEEQPAPNWRNREAFQQWSAAKKTAKNPIISTSPIPLPREPATKIAPTTTIALIALVTAIKGVCNAGVTPQITW